MRASSQRAAPTRIVAAKAKCRHGEQKLAWNTSGPPGQAGPSGAPGANGAPGVNGTGPAFFSSAVEFGPLTEESEVVFTKTVPPGDYVVSTTLVLLAHAASAGLSVGADCFVLDVPGTKFSLLAAETNKEVAEVGVGVWEVGLVTQGAGDFDADTTMALAGALPSTVTSTLGVICSADGSSAGVSVTIPLAQLVAQHVSSIE